MIELATAAVVSRYSRFGSSIGGGDGSRIVTVVTLVVVVVVVLVVAVLVEL